MKKLFTVNVPSMYDLSSLIQLTMIRSSMLYLTLLLTILITFFILLYVTLSTEYLLTIKAKLLPMVLRQSENDLCASKFSNMLSEWSIESNILRNRISDCF